MAGGATVDTAGVVHTLRPGKTLIRASGDGVTGETSVTVVKNPVSGLAVSPETSSAKTGDVVHFSAQDKKGAPIGVEIAWSIRENGAQIWPDGAFVADRQAIVELDDRAAGFGDDTRAQRLERALAENRRRRRRPGRSRVWI